MIGSEPPLPQTPSASCFLPSCRAFLEALVYGGGKLVVCMCSTVDAQNDAPPKNPLSPENDSGQ